MKGYEERRETLWREAYRNDRAFSYDDYPRAQVLSFFKKRKESDPVLNISNEVIVETYPNVVYDRVVEVSWLEDRLNKTIQYTRKWSDYKIYQLGALQEYLDYVKVGGYSKALISTQELAALLPSKK